MVIDCETGQIPPTAAERMNAHDRRMGAEPNRPAARAAPAEVETILDTAEAAPAPRERKDRPKRAKPAGRKPVEEERQDRAPTDRKPPKRERRDEPEAARRAQREEETGEPGEWNGPVPSFLANSAL